MDGPSPSPGWSPTINKFQLERNCKNYYLVADITGIQKIQLTGSLNIDLRVMSRFRQVSHTEKHKFRENVIAVKQQNWLDYLSEKASLQQHHYCPQRNCRSCGGLCPKFLLMFKSSDWRLSLINFYFYCQIFWTKL